MALQLPGISYLRGYDTNPDLVGKFKQGFDFTTGIVNEAEADRTAGDYARSLFMEGQQQGQQPNAAPARPSLSEYGLPAQEVLQGLLSNPETRTQGIQLIRDATAARDQANDPLRQLQIKKAQYDLDTAGQVAPTAEMRNFQMMQQNPKFAEFIGKSGAGNAPAAVQQYLFYRDEEAQAGRQPLSFIDFNKSLKSDGLSVQTNPDGTVSIQQGGAGNGMPKLTEQQSKDVVYYTRGVGALPTLDQFGGSLTNVMEQAMGADPTGVIRGNQSGDFQQAEQAGREFLASILRKDTGAAITAQEMEQYGSIYLPRPGDGEEVLAQKQEARTRALDALKLGIPTAAIAALETQGIGGGAGQATKTIDGVNYVQDANGDWYAQ